MFGCRPDKSGLLATYLTNSLYQLFSELVSPHPACSLREQADLPAWRGGESRLTTNSFDCETGDCFEDALDFLDVLHDQ
jgi:hypothetical protein